jgi:hypothetical protein
MTENSKDFTRRSDHSIFFPLLIIFIGVIILLSNLKLIPGNGFDLILRYWPIFFIFSGFDDLLNRKWTGAIIDFGIGSILILANLGFFSMSTWQIIMNFWPILIIGIGLDIIFRGRSVVSSLIGVGLAILLMLALFWFVFQGNTTKEAISHPIRYELGDIKKVELNIKPLAEKLIISKTNSDELSIDGKIYTLNTENLTIESETNDQIQKILISNSWVNRLPLKNMNKDSLWDLFLNANVPYSINIDQVFGVQNLKLTGLNIQDLQSNLVMGSMEIILPEIEDLNANLECIIGEVVIIIPEGLPVTIKLNSGMTGVSVGDGFIREGNTIYSKHSTINQGIVLNVNLPMGFLKVIHP